MFKIQTSHTQHTPRTPHTNRTPHTTHTQTHQPTAQTLHAHPTHAPRALVCLLVHICLAISFLRTHMRLRACMFARACLYFNYPSLWLTSKGAHDDARQPIAPYLCLLDNVSPLLHSHTLHITLNHTQPTTVLASPGHPRLRPPSSTFFLLWRELLQTTTEAGKSLVFNSS